MPAFIRNRLSRRTVLLADDDPILRDLLVDFLAEEGYDVTPVADGMTALHYAIRTSPAVILLDQRMPRLDGLTFARIYLALPGPHAPLVLMTGDPDARGDELPRGVTLVRKPFALDRLVQVLKSLQPEKQLTAA